MKGAFWAIYEWFADALRAVSPRLRQSGRGFAGFAGLAGGDSWRLAQQWRAQHFIQGCQAFAQMGQGFGVAAALPQRLL